MYKIVIVCLLIVICAKGAAFANVCLSDDPFEEEHGPSLVFNPASSDYSYEYAQGRIQEELRLISWRVKVEVGKRKMVYIGLPKPAFEVMRDIEKGLFGPGYLNLHVIFYDPYSKKKDPVVFWRGEMPLDDEETEELDCGNNENESHEKTNSQSESGMEGEDPMDDKIVDSQSELAKEEEVKVSEERVITKTKKPVGAALEKSINVLGLGASLDWTDFIPGSYCFKAALNAATYCMRSCCGLGAPQVE